MCTTKLLLMHISYLFTNPIGDLQLIQRHREAYNIISFLHVDKFVIIIPGNINAITGPAEVSLWFVAPEDSIQLMSLYMSKTTGIILEQGNITYVTREYTHKC